MLKNIIARFQLNTFLFNYDHNEIADAAVNVLLNEEWKSMQEDNYFINITTKTDKIIKFWSTNQYYAWMRQGTIQNKGKTLQWDNGRPSVYLMYQLLKKIKAFRRKQIAEILK